MNFSLINSLLIVLTCSLFSCCKKKLSPVQLQPDDAQLDKNIPENTAALDYTADPLYDVFICGRSMDTLENVNGFWKNGEWTSIADARELSCILSDGIHTYVYGTKIKSINGLEGYEAFYWVDGNPVKLETSTTEFSEPLAGIYYDGNLYSCGSKRNEQDGTTSGVVWENNKVIYSLPNLTLWDIKAINGSIFVAGVKYDSVHKQYDHVIYKDGVVFYQGQNGHYSKPVFDINNNQLAVLGGTDHYFINSIKKEIISSVGNYPVVNSLTLTNDNKVLLAGTCTLFNDNIAEHYPGLWRNGHFDRLESRYHGELVAVKTIDDREFIAGNIFGDIPHIESQATLWVNDQRYQLKGRYRYTAIENTFVKRK